MRRSHHAFAGAEHTTETVQTGPKMNRFECVKVPALIRSRRAGHAPSALPTEPSKCQKRHVDDPIDRRGGRTRCICIKT